MDWTVERLPCPVMEDHAQMSAVNKTGRDLRPGLVIFSDYLLSVYSSEGAHASNPSMMP